MTAAVFPDLSRYDKGAIDTETTGLSYTDKPVNLSLTLPDKQRFYFAWGHPEGNNCSLNQVRDWAKQFKRSDFLAVFLNAVYDMRMMKSADITVPTLVEDVGVQAALINEYEPDYTLEGLGERKLGIHKADDELNEWCAQHFGGKPTRKAQTKNYHKAPGDMVGRYAMVDTDITLGLHEHQEPIVTELGLDGVYQLETMLIPVLYRMYLAGVKVDVAQARKTQLEFRAARDVLLAEWNRLVGYEVNFKSTQQLAKVFDRFGVPYPRTEKGNPSITKEVLEEIEHPMGVMLRKMRQYEHYSGTFIESYMLDNLQAGDFIHPNFYSVKSDYGGTITGRFSSAGGLNAQNIPARDKELAKIIRAMFIPASKDHQWLKIDYSQIEYRFFGHYAGGQLRRAYNENPLIDFHEMVAAMTGLERRQAKNINFGILYGMGVDKTARQLGVSVEEAQELLDQYHARVPEAKKLYHKAMNRASVRGYILTWAERISRFQSVGVTRKKYLGTHKALNKLLQGSAADLIKRAMIDVDMNIDWESTIMHLTVHDELDFSIPKGREGVRTAHRLKTIMEDYQLTVPIVAEAELGPNWGRTTKLEHLLEAA